MSTAAVPTVMAAVPSNARGAPLALTHWRPRRIQLTTSNATYDSTLRQAEQLWSVCAIKCFWEKFCMEPHLEAEVSRTALIDLGSTADRREGQCDVRPDEPASRAKLAHRCVKMFLGEVLHGAAPGGRGTGGGIDRPEIDGRAKEDAHRHAHLLTHTH